MTLINQVLEFAYSFKWYGLATVVLIYAARKYHEYRRLSAFQGPWLAAFTDLWFAKWTVGIGEEGYKLLADVCWKYGTLARIGPNQLVTCEPELIMRMSAARSLYTKDEWYHSLKMPPGEHNIFSQTDEATHTRRRAQMTEGYSGKTNTSIEPTIDTHVRNLTTLIREKYISSSTSFKPIDMGRKSGFFTMDVITDIAFGKTFGNLTSDSDMHEYIEMTESLLPLMMKMTVIPFLRTIVQWDFVSKALMPSDTSEKGIGKLLGIAKSLVHERYAKGDSGPRDMISVFMQHGLNEKDLVCESLLAILAGSDTTAAVIRVILLHVVTHSVVLNTLQAEIDDFVRSKSTSAADDNDVEYDSVIKDAEAKELPYLQAVIRECLRIWPPVTTLLTKLSPPEGDSFDIDIHGAGTRQRVFIPGGTKIGVASWAVQRNKSVFGEDAALFRPERWLIDDQEKVAYMHKVVGLNFGYGKYQCLGQPIAQVELNKCTFEIVNPATPWKSQNSMLWLQSQLWMKVTERDNSP